MSRWFLRRYVIMIVLRFVFVLAILYSLNMLNMLKLPLVGPNPPPAMMVSGNVLPSSTTIKYFGRWDKHDQATYDSYWGGAYFKTDFTGRHVQLRLANPASLYVRIDGGADVHINAVRGLSSLNLVPLTAGRHALRVAAGSESTTISFQGLVLDHNAFSLAPHSSPVTVEFVGDSITAGWTDTMGDLSSYAWLSAEKLGVEHIQIASSGICLKTVVTIPSCRGMQTQFFKLRPGAAADAAWWNGKSNPPDAIVINLGTNDYLHGQFDNAFEIAYIVFIQQIRQLCPRTPIYVMRTFSGLMEVPTREAVARLNAAGYYNVFYVDTTGWLMPNTSDFNDQYHPSDAGQRKVAMHLVEVLRPIARII